MHMKHILELLSQLPEWGMSLIVLALTWVIAISLYRILWKTLDKVIEADQILARQIITRIGPIVRYAFLLLAVSICAPHLSLPDALATSLNRLMMAAFVFLLGWMTVLASNLAIDRYIRRFDITTAGQDNLMARKTVTQMRLLRRTMDVAIFVITLGLALMQFETVRQYGVSLFASAGIAGLAIGLAARPLLGNLIAGIQLALTQPIRIDDVVIVEGEWGKIESFSATYVVINIWDQRRLIVPLSYFLEKPFQNWTHTSTELLGTIYYYTDYTVPVTEFRETFLTLAKQSPLWDGRVLGLQVTNTTDKSVELRGLVSAKDSSALWDFRCEMREKMMAWLQETYPSALPRLRAELPSEPKI